MQVIYPTTPAQYAHALRRQMKNNPRKPLIVISPKSLLRHPLAVSPGDDLTDSRFEPVLHDVATSDQVKRVIITSGKVYYDLRQARDKASANVAILRLEQFYPFPQADARRRAQAVSRRDRDRLGPGRAPQHGRVAVPPRAAGRAARSDGQKLSYVGRPVAAAPATGSHHRHDEQQKALVEKALG